jgi:hypothetical protein
MLEVSEKFSDFLRAEFVVHDTSFGGGPRYLYRNPIDYWASFHYPYAHWGAGSSRVSFCKLEDLVGDPNATVKTIAEFAGHKVIKQDISYALSLETRPGRDGSAPNVATMKARTTNISGNDAQYIRGSIPEDLLEFLGYGKS